MMKQNILSADIFKDRLIIHQGRNRCRCIARYLIIIKPFHAVHFHQERQIQGAIEHINIVLLDLQLFLQDL